MRSLLPDPVVGSLAGFCLGFLASLNLRFVGVDGTGWVAVGWGIVGAAVGGDVGLLLQGPQGRARTVARWCAVSAVAVGGIAFLAGFVGPLVLRPDLPQGPMLGIFVTGPLGALLGACAGAVLGLLAPSPSAAG